MSEHRVFIQWRRSTSSFTYDSYNRSFELRFEGGLVLEGSAAAEYLGRAEHANPEEMFAASLSACHMLTFLAFAARSRMTVDSYEDDPVAVLEKDAYGVLCVTRVHLRPRVSFAEQAPPVDKFDELHEKAHKNCFIANSVKCQVSVEPQIV